MTFKDKQKLVNEKLLSMRGTTDKTFIKTIYGSTFLDDEFEYNEFIKTRLKNTIYSHLTNEEIFNIFKGENFSNLKRVEKECAFQEILNRHIDNNGCTKRYICSLEDLESEELYAGIRNTANLLLINNSVIEKYSEINANDKTSKFNKVTIGPMYYMAILHEAQHNVQTDLIIDRFLNENLSESQNFLADVSLLMMSCQRFGFEFNDKEMLKEFRDDYCNFYDEHNSNFVALKLMNEATSKIKNNKEKQNLQKITAFFSALALDKKLDFFDKNFNKEKFIKERIINMENCINKYIGYMEENFYVDDFRNNLVQNIKKQMNIDEKTKTSWFRNHLKQELNFMVDCVLEYTKNANKEDYETLLQSNITI